MFENSHLHVHFKRLSVINGTALRGEENRGRESWYFRTKKRELVFFKMSVSYTIWHIREFFYF